ncbi:MAG: hypothetical protein ABIL62_11560 [Planctomycetota bacterium]
MKSIAVFGYHHQPSQKVIFILARLLGSNMDIYDLSDVDNVKLVSSGPRLDPSECVGFGHIKRPSLLHVPRRGFTGLPGMRDRNGFDCFSVAKHGV